MLCINEQRLLDDLEALGQVGRTAAGGVSRPALSAADAEGRAWFRERVLAAGLDFRQDGAGNLSAVLPSTDSAARTLLAGSHLDSVPDGGRFDGALGILAAFEALRTIHEAGLALPVHLEAIAFTDEEGAVVSLLGSRAVTGTLDPHELEQPRCDPAVLRAGMERLGITPQSILASRRDPAALAAYVELHIEQGTRLEDAGVNIGVVTSIVGIWSYWLHFEGEAAHAGTRPMSRRADALWGAAEFVGRARALVMERFSPGVMNCGQLVVSPGAFNIVPARVRLALEFRHGTEAQMDEMDAALKALAFDVARDHGLALTIEPASRTIPARLDERVMAAIERAAERTGCTFTRLVSFAGHDAQSMQTIIPSSMLFVPSVNGVSHAPQEYTRPEDVVNGANVLLHTLLVLAGDVSA